MDHCGPNQVKREVQSETVTRNEQQQKSRTIFRAVHDETHPYVKVAQAAAQDKNLTFEARGILLYLLSKPKDWTIQIADLMREGHTGKDRVLRILQELEDHGYVIWSRERRQIHQRDGTFIWTDATIYESGNAPCSENPNMDKPEPEKPAMVKPESGKPDSYKERIVQTNDLTKRDSFSLLQSKKEIQIIEKHTQSPDDPCPEAQGLVCVSPTSIDLINVDQEEEEQNPWDHEPWTYNDVMNHVKYRRNQGDEIRNPTGLVKSILEKHDPNDYIAIENSLMDIDAQQIARSDRLLREEAERLRRQDEQEERERQAEAKRAEEQLRKAEEDEAKRQREIEEAPRREAARLAKQATDDEALAKLDKMLQDRKKAKANAA
jgi:hypothetical protein